MPDHDVGREGATPAAVTIRRVPEAELGGDLSRQVTSLLRECFAGYPDRSYFKLPPHFRYLALTGDGVVAGQLGVELRIIRVGDVVLRTFGVVDVCVRESGRSHGLASLLLAAVTEYARACDIAFIVLFANDDRLYLRNGWLHARNRCSWVKIDEHVTLGLSVREDPAVMLVKAIDGATWTTGDVDLLGHLF